jgi:dolichol-phosphate mannosyltransferase
MNSVFPQINIIVPLFNESAVFEELIGRLKRLIADNNLRIEIILIDDGSTDDTALKMKSVSLSNDKIHSLFLSKNFGQQEAIVAGLEHVNATEGVLILDGDLQDPPELLNEFYAHLQEGYDVIYAIRKKRKESFVKVFFYGLFYRMLSSISESKIFLDSGDFSLISIRVVKLLSQMPEKGKFIRGMRSWVGFNQKGIEYERDERALGKSKYSTKKLIQLAMNGLFNFSDFPIKLISRFGLLIISTSLVYFIYVVFKKFFLGNVPDGFTALLFMIILFGGLQLLAIGVIGQYIVRVFFQVKNRPTYILKEKIIKSVSKKD